jgi:glycosyltransferase involved in cell wall biosynthesis
MTDEINEPKKPQLKVLEVIRQGQVGGGETHLLSLVSCINREKFTPFVLSFTDGPMVDALRAMDIETFVITTEKPFAIGVWKQVKGLMIEHGIDLVHAHGTRACSNVIWPAQKLGIPVIYTVHGWSFHPDQPWLIQTIRKWGERWLTRKATVNIAVSHSNKQTGEQLIPGIQMTVINNGISFNKFNAHAEYPDIRAALGIDKNALLVVFLARFTHHKQPLVLLRAFQKIAKKIPNAHLLMVGDGDQKAEALEMAEKAEAKMRMHFIPFRKDVPAILAAADLYVLPSLWEGLPIGLLEAMAMKKAICASKVDGTIDVLEHMVSGYLIDAKDLESNLEEALFILLQNEDLRHQLAAGAFDAVQKGYNETDMTRKIEQVYLQVSH